MFIIICFSHNKFYLYFEDPSFCILYHMSFLYSKKYFNTILFGKSTLSIKREQITQHRHLYSTESIKKPYIINCTSIERSIIQLALYLLTFFYRQKKKRYCLTAMISHLGLIPNLHSNSVQFYNEVHPVHVPHITFY